MRGLFALLAVTGVIMPPRVDSNAPFWVDNTTVQFGYAVRDWNHAQYVANLDGSGFRPTDAPPPDRSASPNGQYQYSLDERTNALEVGGKVIKGPVYPGLDHVAWSPDSQHLAYADGRDDNIHVVNRHGDGDHRVGRGAAVAWLSPTELAIGQQGRNSEIDAVSIDGKHSRRLVSGFDSPNGLDASPDGKHVAFTSYVGWGYDIGAAVYVAGTDGFDSHVVRISPDVCSVDLPLLGLGGRCFDGTDRPDRIVGTVKGDLIVTGSGDDVIHAGDGVNQIQSQWGDDTILSGSGADFVHAGGGSDVIRTGGGADWITPGPGRDVVYAGTGNDHVIANDNERDVIDCGPGDDGARVDPFDGVRNCEHVTTAPPNPDQGY